MRRAAIIVAVVLATRPLCAATDEARLDEYQVKAAFLYNFAKFVEWPAPPAATALFVLGIVGDERIVSVVEAVVRGKTIHGRSLQVRALRPGEDPATCQMLFVTLDEERQASDLVRRARASAVLTIGESAPFLRDGGIIRFVAEEKRVRFQVNAEAAQRAGLKISSQLLSLALPSS